MVPPSPGSRSPRFFRGHPWQGAPPPPASQPSALSPCLLATWTSTAPCLPGAHTTLQFGNPFMVRRSYLPTEIVWGHQFKQVIQKPWGGDTRYAVNLTSYV